MARAQAETITKADLVASRLSIIVHNVSMQTTKKDLQSLIKRRTVILPDVEFGRPYDSNGERRQNAFLNFKKVESVDEFMKGGSLTHQGHEMKISRRIPRSCPFAGYMTPSIVLTIYETEQENRFRKELVEFHLERYFQDFGGIIASDWQSSHEVILLFDNYDSVDRIILHDVSHTINGIKVDIQKTLTMPKSASSTPGEGPYCIHVTNMPLDVTSDELSVIFSVHVADILLQPGDPLSSHLASNDRSTSEAWIKYRSDRRSIEDLAKKYSRITIRGYEVYLEVVPEPFNVTELCLNFEKGDCTYPADRCHYKHILCNEPDECDNRKCWFGHSRKRLMTSFRRPAKNTETNGYRVRFSNIPSTVTKEQILDRLNIPSNHLERLKFPNQPITNKPIVVYVINQPSENLLRAKIREWHNIQFSPKVSNRIKCQLERNMNYHNWDDRNDLSETLIGSRRSSTASEASSHIQSNTVKTAPWCNGKKGTPSTSIQTDQSDDTNLGSPETNNTPSTTRKKAMKTFNSGLSDLATLAPQWRWTNKKLSNDSPNKADVYLLVDKTDKELNAAIKVYKTKLIPTAQQDAEREKLILEKLQGLDGTPQLITSNIDVLESDNDPWFIMEHIEGVPLLQYVKPNLMSLRDKLIITIKLLNIIRDIHSRNIVHRLIKPEDIIIRTSLDSNEIDLVLISFSEACLIQNDQPNNPTIFDNNRGYILNPFYQAYQLQRQPSTGDDQQQNKNLTYSPSIDISSVCAILFWLITGRYPIACGESDREAPHKKKLHINAIDKELTKATGIWTEIEKRLPLQQHVELIFDRGFTKSDQQWSIEELDYHLQHMLQLAARKNEENNCFPPPLTKKQIESSETIIKPNSFLQLSSLIDSMKRQFSIRYPDIRWSIDKKSQWSGDNQEVKNIDFLTFQRQQRSIVIETCCCAWMSKNQELMIKIMAKTDQINTVTLRLGIWKEYEQEDIQEEIRKIFELELKILIDIFYKKKFMLSI